MLFKIFATLFIFVIIFPTQGYPQVRPDIEDLMKLPRLTIEANIKDMSLSYKGLLDDDTRPLDLYLLTGARLGFRSSFDKSVALISGAETMAETLAAFNGLGAGTYYSFKLGVKDEKEAIFHAEVNVMTAIEAIGDYLKVRPNLNDYLTAAKAWRSMRERGWGRYPIMQFTKSELLPHVHEVRFTADDLSLDYLSSDKRQVTISKIKIEGRSDGSLRVRYYIKGTILDSGIVIIPAPQVANLDAEILLNFIEGHSPENKSLQAFMTNTASTNNR